MKKYVCDPCGYEYDPAVGDPDNGIAPGTAFEAHGFGPVQSEPLTGSAPSAAREKTSSARWIKEQRNNISYRHIK